jgi:hypothetical protein
MKKGEAKTQEKICGKACSFCLFLFIMPLKIYVSGGKFFSTNDNIGDDGFGAVQRP